MLVLFEQDLNLKSFFFSILFLTLLSKMRSSTRSASGKGASTEKPKQTPLNLPAKNKPSGQKSRRSGTDQRGVEGSGNRASSPTSQGCGTRGAGESKEVLGAQGNQFSPMSSPASSQREVSEDEAVEEVTNGSFLAQAIVQQSVVQEKQLHNQKLSTINFAPSARVASTPGASGFLRVIRVIPMEGLNF